jgi:hypothetical protein
MASEINLSASLTATKNGAGVDGNGSLVLDMSGTEMSALVQTLSTSEAQLTLGGVDSLAAILIKNLSAVAVTISLNTPATQVVSIVPANGIVLLTGVSTTLYGKCASGTADIFIVAVEA